MVIDILLVMVIDEYTNMFIGRDLLNQLAMIFGTFGVPSRQYLHSLDSETVCGFIKSNRYQIFLMCSFVMSMLIADC